MNSKRNEFHSPNGQNGFSLIETLVVIVIIAVVATLAFMQMGTADTRFKRQNVARELKVAFERARFDSVKRHADGPNPAGTPLPATVVVDTSSYTLNTDTNRDGTYETQVTNFASHNITIAPRSLGAVIPPVTVTFDKRGETTAVDADGITVDPQFYVCNVSCSSPTSANADLILVSPTGTVNLLGGSAAPPTFANANVTAVPPTTGINNLVRLP